jgi:hypothetical protein
MALFGVWTEAGVLYVGPRQGALENTLLDEGDDLASLQEAAAEIKSDDAMDTHFPGGIRTLVELTGRYKLVATLNRLSIVDSSLPSAQAELSQPTATAVAASHELDDLGRRRGEMVAESNGHYVVGNDRLTPFEMASLRLTEKQQSTELRDPLGTPESKRGKLDGLIDIRVKETLQQRERGAEALAAAIAITTNHTMSHEERLLLRSEMRDGAIDQQQLGEAMKTGSFAKVMGELERGMVRQIDIRSQLADQQRDLIGRVNLAESFLPVRDQKTLETALIDGRVNLKTMQRFFETGQDQRIVNTIQELDEEYEVQMSRDASREIGR